MATSDDFKQELKAGNFGKALKLALSEAIELQITTWVVPANASGSEPKIGQPGSRMRTRINIVDGDIDNEVGTQFLSNGPYTELRQFHIEQVQQGRETIQKNLQGLQKIFGLLLDVTQGEAETDSAEDADSKQRSTIPIHAYITDESITGESIPTVPVESVIPSEPVTVDFQPASESIDFQATPEPSTVSPEIFQAPPTSVLAPEALGDLSLPEDAPLAPIVPQAIVATSATALLGTIPAAIAAPSIAADISSTPPPSATAAAETDPLDPQALGDLTLPPDLPVATLSEASVVEPVTVESPSQETLSVSGAEVFPTDVLGDVPEPDEIPLEFLAAVEAPLPVPFPDPIAEPFADTTGFALGGSVALTDADEVEAALNSLFPDSTVEESYPSATDFMTGEESVTGLPDDLFESISEETVTPEPFDSPGTLPDSPETLTDLFGETGLESSHPLPIDPTAAVELEASLPDLFDETAEDAGGREAIADLQLPPDDSLDFGLEAALPDDLLSTTAEEIPNPYALDPITNLELEDSLTDLFAPEAAPSLETGAASTPEMEESLTSLFAPAADLDSLETEPPATLFQADVDGLTDLFPEPTGDLSLSEAEATDPSPGDLFAEPGSSPSSLEASSPATEASLIALFEEEELAPALDLPLEELDSDSTSAESNLLAAFEVSPVDGGTADSFDPIDASLIDLFTEPDTTSDTYPPLTTLESELILDSESGEGSLAEMFAPETLEAPVPAPPPIPLSELFNESTPDVSLLFAEAPPIDPNLSVEESLAVLFPDPAAVVPESDAPAQAVPEIDEAALSALFADASDSAYSFTDVSETSEELVEFPSLVEESETEAATNPFADFLSTADLPLEDTPQPSPPPEVPTLLPPPARKKRDQNN